MERDLPEADWKKLRKLHEVALDRFCRRALTLAGPFCAEGAGSSHDRYLALYALIKEQDEELGLVFNDLRRSNAKVHLCALVTRKLITPEEFAQFSEETRDLINTILRERLD